MTAISFLSICSGIEAASVAWEPLGFRAVGFSEIEAFPSAVLAHRYGSNMPGEPLSHNAIPNHGDFTQIDTGAIPAPLEVLVGGTPCQAFSIAGKRLSLDDARGNLTLSFVVLAHGLARSHGLRNIVWENVPGVLNTPDNAFGCFLGALVGADDALHPPGGAGWPGAGMVAGPLGRAAWRVLDAQYFGVPQRRRRVFLVADLGGGADPATVLFEPKGVLRHPPARGKAGQGAAGDAQAGAGERGAFGGGHPEGHIAGTVSAKWAKGSGGPAGDELYNMVAHALRSGGHSASHANAGVMPAIAYAFPAELSGTQVAASADISPALGVGHTMAAAFDLRGRDGGAAFEGPHDTANIRAASGGSSRSYVADRYVVRRLTPTECERLQGFSDGWTQIPWRGKPSDECPDGPRYKALGNSMAVPVMAWIGERLRDALLGTTKDKAVTA